MPMPPAAPGRPIRLPSLRALRAFEVVGRHLNLHDAAAELSVTPSAISHQVRLLEKDLGVELFSRKGRGLELTERGRELLPLLTSVFADLASVLGQFRQGRSASQVLVQMPATFATRWFLPNLSSFEQAHPDVEVRLLSSEDSYVRPMEGLDCAIRFGRSGWAGYSEYPLCVEELVAVCGPRLLGRAEQIRAEDIGGFRLLVAASQPDAWKIWFQSLGLKLRGDARTLSFQSRELALRGAVENLGLALASMVEVADDVRHGRLVFALGNQGPVINGAYYLAVHQSRERSPAVAALSEWVKSEFRRQARVSDGEPWFAKGASVRPYRSS